MDKIVLEDLENTRKIIDEKDFDEKVCSKIYARTNEDLEKLFSCFSVKGKKVLSVMASSDQVFCAYYNGAFSVDTFDVNRLSKHYYYLRKWLLQYMGELFPSNKEMKTSDRWIYDVLSMVECKSFDEELSYNYWYSYYIMKTYGNKSKKLFVFNEDFNKMGIMDKEKLIDIIKSHELVFRHQDICCDICKDKKYDTVIMSNILEYDSYFEDKERLKKCRDNLYDILNDGGEVICTNMITEYPLLVQLEIFGEKFDYESFDVGAFYRSNTPVGYCYRKR